MCFFESVLITHRTIKILATTLVDITVIIINNLSRLKTKKVDFSFFL